MEHSGAPVYLVLGTNMGSAVSYFLSSFPGTSRVYLTDIDKRTARDAADAVNRKLLHGSRLCCGFDFNTEKDDLGSLLQMFPDIRVVVSALPARFSPELAEASIAKGRHFLELGGVTEISRELKKLHRKALRQKVSVVSDNGLMPGTGLVLARELVYALPGGVVGLYITVGGVPQHPLPPLYYMPLFSLEGLRHLCFDESPVILRGEIENLPPFSFSSFSRIPELAEFHNRGWVEAFVTSGAADAARIFRKLGVKNFWERTLRWPGFMEFVKNTAPENFAEELLRVSMPPVGVRNPDLVWMKVEADGFLAGGKESRLSYTLFDLFDQETGFSAMQRTTGFSAALMAHFAALGKTRLGVFSTESALSRKNMREYISMLKAGFSLRYEAMPVAG